MAKKKKMIFGANEKPNDSLQNVSNYSAPQTNYPITFGKGAWSEDVFTTILTKDDSKIRFVYEVNDTSSGAIFVGNKLASSKVLDIKTNETDNSSTSEVTVKYIDINGSIKETKFGVVDPSLFEGLEVRVESLENWAKDTIITSPDNGALTITPENNADGFNKYQIKVNVDNEIDDISILNNKITISQYTLESIPLDPDSKFASQYQLKVKKPGEIEFTTVGETINIFKDFFLKDAHVCTYDKMLLETGEVKDYNVDESTKIEDLEDVYAIIFDPSIADASGYIIDPSTGDQHTVYLEKAPTNQGLYVYHTYLHLIVNTTNDDEETETDSNNNTETDVYLDFTDILGSGVFAELKELVDEIDKRVEKIESSYVKDFVVPESVSGEQFKTITVTTSKDGEDSSTSFDIPDSEYYEMVADNFAVLNADCSTFANSLTWHGID